MTDTYESWRITFQSSEAAARSAYADVERLAMENAELRKKLEQADRLCGQLTNCVNLLHRLKRNGCAMDALAADKAIDSANAALYEMTRGEMKTIPIPVQVPDWAKWVAQDQDGGWWAHELEPDTRHAMWQNDGRISFICRGMPANPNWRETLREVE